MAHNIYNGRFLERSGAKPAWHGMGKSFDEDMLVSEAFPLVNMDYRVDKYQHHVLLNGSWIPTKSYEQVRSANGDDEAKLLGTVSSRWKGFQPIELAKTLDPLTAKYPLETIGSIRDGSVIFVTLQAGQTKIVGDDHDLYWLITDSFDGSSPMSISFTPVRVVCENTLVLARNRATISSVIQHNSRVDSDWSLSTEVFADMQSVMEKSIQEIEGMAKVGLTAQMAIGIVENVYRDAPKPKPVQLSDGVTHDDLSPEVRNKLILRATESSTEWEHKMELIRGQRDGAVRRYDIFNQQFPDKAMTGLALYNAIVENEDYRRGLGDSKGSAFHEGARADNKRKAHTAILSLA